jgi:hypothetical protein
VADIEGGPIIADVSGDGHPEIICGYPSGFTILDSLGNTLSGFPDETHDAILPIVADVDNSGGVATVVGSSDWNLYAYKSDGLWAPGFPIPFGNRLESSPAIYDIDNDGKLELMVSSYDYRFYVLDLETEWIEWPKFRYDQYNSGFYKSGNLPGIMRSGDLVAPESFGLRIMPSIFSDKVEIVFNAARDVLSDPASPITLQIFDATGRLIKDFEIRAGTPGPVSPVVWCGDDNHGRKIAAGVYFARFETKTHKFTEKFIKIR